MDATGPEWEKAALVTIDVQMDTLDGRPLEVAGTSAALPAMAKLCSAARSAERPIIHVVRLYRADGSNAEPCRRALASGPEPVLRPGTPGRLIAPELFGRDSPSLDDDLLLDGGIQHLGPNEVAIYKPRWGAFYRTPLDDHLRDLEVSTLIFAGCNFPNCPRTSIYEASERDYQLVLAVDAVSGLYERGRAELAGIGVNLLTADTIADSLDTSSHSWS